MTLIGRTEKTILDLEAMGDSVVWDTAQTASATFQAALGNAFSGWQGGVITLTKSIDGSNFGAIGSGVTFSGNGFAGPIDIAWPFIKAEVTTAASGTAQVTVAMHAKDRRQQ
jgi:hypothetical protein